MFIKLFQVNYDRRVRPEYGGEPVSVGVTLYVLSVSEISEKFMDFTFDMYFRQFWKDSRLTFPVKVMRKAPNKIQFMKSRTSDHISIRTFYCSQGLSKVEGQKQFLRKNNFRFQSFVE